MCVYAHGCTRVCVCRLEVTLCDHSSDTVYFVSCDRVSYRPGVLAK